MRSPRALGSHTLSKNCHTRSGGLPTVADFGSTAACITVSHSGTPRCDCDNTVRYSTVRNSVRYRSAIPSHLTEGRAECAKHTKVTNCVRGFVISLRTLLAAQQVLNQVLHRALVHKNAIHGDTKQAALWNCLSCMKKAVLTAEGCRSMLQLGMFSFALQQDRSTVQPLCAAAPDY